MPSPSRFPLVDATRFHDACGTGFVAEVSGTPGDRVVALAFRALRNLAHRGARGADDTTGDGAGLLTDLPAAFFRKVARLTPGGPPRDGERLAVAMTFASARVEDAFAGAVAVAASRAGLRLLGKRRVPVDSSVLGEVARASCPAIGQFLLACPEDGSLGIEQRCFLARRYLERRFPPDGEAFVCSLSSRTVVYKGLLTPEQLERFYPDLSDPDFRCRFAVFHDRFATNTRPTWSMAQPFRVLAHNGEINTIKGNRLWMRTREGESSAGPWPDGLDALGPLVAERGSDSFSLDNAVEFVSLSGRGPLHALMMLIPEPYAGDAAMSEALRSFYVYHENLVEPWDGPAAIVFADGRYVGARLDRNGLRPLRYTRTRGGLVILASEAGIIDVEDSDLLLHHHMASGEIFAVDLEEGRVLDDDAIKTRVAATAPYESLLRENFLVIRRGDAAEEFGAFALPEGGFDARLRIALGWSREDLSRLVIPMAESGREPLGSMGDDTPPAALSAEPRRLYDFFKQSFAQVTNPPIDPIREGFVTSLHKYLGSEDDLLAGEPRFRGAIRIESPVLSPRDVRLLLEAHDTFPHRRIACHAPLGSPLDARLEEIDLEAEAAARDGVRLLILTDEGLSPEVLPVPTALAVAAVHHHLVRRRLRSRVSLLCAAGDVVEDHHVACLIAMGASAVYPYMAYELVREGLAERPDWVDAMARYRWALEKGLLKIMSKMGVSTNSSYHGSMLLHALGLSDEVLARWFPSIEGPIGGVGLGEVRARLERLHAAAFGPAGPGLEDRGIYRFRRDGERHGFAPDAFRRIHKLAAGERAGAAAPSGAVYLRDLFALAPAEAVPLAEVEPARDVLKRFGSGGVSFGAISDAAHRALARGLAIVGGRSNSGEGGESPDRFAHGNPDRTASCWVKQVASARFGVSTDYLAAAREIQIKMAQGSKPGEGGQLPGFKVTLRIAAARSATPGVPLISPPPHHDIYSIEDLAQLVHDLRAVNPRAAVSVKLVSQPGVGVVACGVAKAGADVVLISGGDGGTGASPLGSIKHAGLPWEIGLAEAHQALTANGLRERVVVRVDGGLKSGRDVVVAALLGAEQFDFGTAALVALGCVMARQCHLNTCPVGIATQDEALERKLRGTPEDVARFLAAVAEEVREDLAALGVRTLGEAVGRSGLLRIEPTHESRVRDLGLDLSRLLNPQAGDGLPLARRDAPQRRPPPRTLDDEVLSEVRPALLTHGTVVAHRAVTTRHRAVGARLAGEIAFLYGRGSFHGNIQLRLRGSAGQSFGAFLTEGLELRLRGVANDHVGKGMSGGLVTVRFPRAIRERGAGLTIIGNVALYGATGGVLLVAGRAGERFAVRNSGATAVVEGVGNHGCEYMTRGTVVVLGEIGRNFGAGMTGGVAFVLGAPETLLPRLNLDFVRAELPTAGDQSLLLRLLRRHLFHTGSVLARGLIAEWSDARSSFVKIVPLALDSLDFEAIYDRHVAERMAVLLGE